MLIIIDTLNRAAPGIDENSPNGMGQVLSGAAAIQTTTGGLVLMVHHPGKDTSRGLRGHSSLYAAMDAVIEVDRNGDSRWLKLTKAKDGEDGIIHPFRLAQIELDANEFGKANNSCIVEFLPTSMPAQAAPKEPAGGNQRALLLGFHELLAEDRIARHAANSPWRAGIPFEDAVSKLKERLKSVAPQRQRERTKAGLESLVRARCLQLTEGMLTLPSSQPALDVPAMVSPGSDEEGQA